MKKELTDKQHRELLELGYAGGNRISDLIEFLGDDLMEIKTETSGYTVRCEDYRTYVGELCDALFEAVKYKLKQ